MNNQTGTAPAGIDPVGRHNSALKCVHKIFELEVEKNPQGIALVHGSEKLTYSDLNVMANRIAHYLVSQGVGSETLVSISMGRSPELIASILGILKAGGAYLPIDADNPPDRLKSILKDANAFAVLTNSAHAGQLSVDGVRKIRVDEIDLNAQESKNLDTLISPENLAYVMFTSGSTGRPKGVMVEHRSIVRLVKHTDYADFGADQVFLHFAPITFDASTFEIWGALLNGASLAIMPDGVSSLSDLGAAIRDYGVTTLWLTAGLFHLMVDERIDDLKPLKQLLAGGDVLSVTHVRKVLEKLDCDLINGYGPTENTTFTCTYKIPRDADLGKSIPIGKPIANTQVIILDKDLQPVGDGEVGELFIGGEGVARGYLGAEELTSERFILNHFESISSTKLYRSGDLARFMADGNVEFLGRADKQVKMRGFRIELEEIEIALTNLRGVREAIVVARDISATDKQLIGFVVPEIDCVLDVSEVRGRLSDVLPDYMVPSLLVPLDALPLTANGKIDRAALIAMTDVKSKHAMMPESTGTDDESRIRKILEEILGSGALGVNDNFFDLGASSLQIAKFHNRLQATFDPKLKIVSLFQNPTISSLARAIGSDDSAKAGIAIVQNRAARQRQAYERRRQLLNGGNLSHE